MLAAAWLAGAGARPCPAQTTLFDGRFDDLRRASVEWDRRAGPERQVVDMVCLVPDVPSFFEAIAAWDEHHFFPVLIDDVETSLKFLRVFRPARVVRYPGRPGQVAPGDMWEAAITAAGRAWAPDSAPAREVPRGDVVPKSLGPTPPGVVLSTPDSPSLAGAVALAAGRFQPLLGWNPGKTFADDLKAEEAIPLARTLEAVLAEHVHRYDRLGDDCDFVTLAGDYPYRYTGGAPSNPFGDGPNAFDDLVLRASKGARRWAFAGRLMGGPAESVYRAMCSLFLRPGSAMLFNTYAETGPPWTEYEMTAAASRLNRLLPSAHREGAAATLAGWHQAFDPVSRYGLVMVNSRGGATEFHPGGHTADIPESCPVAVTMLHSYSAAEPKDPDTLAGRWLANGAFIYFGAMHEPGLQAFRPPSLIAACLAANLPLSAAVKRLESELFGWNWRLVYFGDPLYRLKPVGVAASRLASWEPVADWPAYVEYLQPEADTRDDVRLNWALKTAIVQTRAGVGTRQRGDLPGVLLGVARDRLDARLVPVYDALLVDTLLSAGRSSELLERLSRIPPAARSVGVRRHLETAQMAALQRAVSAKDFRQAEALWTDVIRAPGSRDFVKVFTERVGNLADGPTQLADWRTRLRAAARAAAPPASAPVIEAELKKTEEKIEAARRAG
jgi:hypothetical protein